MPSRRIARVKAARKRRQKAANEDNKEDDSDDGWWLRAKSSKFTVDWIHGFESQGESFYLMFIR